MLGYPKPTWVYTEHRTLKKSRCVVCLFYKHIQIFDIQCISKSSVLCELKKKKKKIDIKQTESEEEMRSAC